MKTKQEKQKIRHEINELGTVISGVYSGEKFEGARNTITALVEAIIGEPVFDKPAFEVKPGEIWVAPQKMGGAHAVILKQPDGLFYVAHFDGRDGENPLSDASLSWVPQPYKTVCDVLQSQGFKRIGKVITRYTDSVTAP